MVPGRGGRLGGGCPGLIWRYDDVWGGRPDADVPAGYVHGLLRDPRRAPPGLGTALLDRAGARIAARGLPLLRLDFGTFVVIGASG